MVENALIIKVDREVQSVLTTLYIKNTNRSLYVKLNHKRHKSALSNEIIDITLKIPTNMSPISQVSTEVYLDCTYFHVTKEEKV